MERKTNYKSVDDLIQMQSNRVSELKQVISLISDRKYLSDDMKKIFIMITKLKENIELLKQEKKRCNAILAQMESCHEQTKSIERKITHIENNFPHKFNKINYTNDMMESTLNENMPNTPQMSIRRHLDFMDSFCHSAQKLQMQSQFTEMQYLTQEQFQSIPGYMRGRVTYETLNLFIDKINGCLEEKYNILSVGKNNLKKRADIDKYIIYKRQECPETKGKMFFTQDDLKNVLGGKIDKHTFNLLTMLRHTRHIREIRYESLLRYIKQ